LTNVFVVYIILT